MSNFLSVCFGTNVAWQPCVKLELSEGEVGLLHGRSFKIWKSPIPIYIIFKPLKLLPQLSMKFILLTNVIMPTVAGILTFIKRIICTTSEHFKQEKLLTFLYFSFHEQLNFI